MDTSPYEETPTTLADMPLLKDFTIGRQVAHFGNDSEKCLLSNQLSSLDASSLKFFCFCSGLLYFTVKILNDGNLLQIVTNSSSHGTHVAAIAAAYYPPLAEGGSCDDPPALALDPDETNENGIAPGAQIVGIKIADSHLGGLEINTALLTAVCILRKRQFKGKKIRLSHSFTPLITIIFFF